MATYWGYPEIVWAAWEAIGTVTAVGLTLAVLLVNRFSSILYCPNINASDFNLQLIHVLDHMEFTGIGSLESSKIPIRVQKIKITWRIKNKPRYLLFGAHAFNVDTHIWFDKKGDHIWAFNKTIDPVIILPIGDSWIQEARFQSDQLEPGDYEIFLHFSSEKRVIGKKKIILTYDPPAEEEK